MASEEIQNQEYEQYAGWLLAVKLAEWSGMLAGVTDSNSEETTFAIGLPSGDIEIIVPTELAEGVWKSVSKDSLTKNEGWYKVVQDCLNGKLVLRHTLIIPEKKEETE